VSSDDSAEEIRRRMTELRRDLTSDVRDVRRSAREMASNARQMASPLYIIRRYPWASAAAAAAVGFMLVPKKKQVITPDPEMLAELVRKQQVKLDTSHASGETQGMLKSLAVMGITWATKAGMNYAIQQLTTAAMNKAQASSESPTESTTTPVDESWNVTG
jgi:hypothetical protein